MAASIRTSLLALLLASTLVPLAGLAVLEWRGLQETGEAQALGEAEREALRAAVRADAATVQGADPLQAASAGAAAEAVLLVARDGAVAGDPSLDRWPQLRERAGDTISGADTVARPDGGAARVAWARAPSADALVVLVEPAAAPAPPVIPFVLLAAFTAAGVFIVLAFVATRIVGPVRRLESASRRVARGAWGSRVEVEGPKEVRALAAAFNEMARSLEAQRGELDTLLADRTRALIDREGDLDALRFTLAHEFREPVRSLRWIVDDLLEAPLAPSTHEALTLLRRRIDDLDAVFRDLLRYAEITRRDAPMETVDLGEMVELARRSAEDAGPLRIEAEPMPRVVGNVALLRAALGEILRNVAQHGRGRVVVTAEREGGEVTLRFDDMGPGVPAARREDAFELFQRLRRDAGGTGVGLAIARRAVERHDGEMWLEEAPGGGARVVVRLPEAGPAPRAPPPETKAGRRF